MHTWTDKNATVACLGQSFWAYCHLDSLQLEKYQEFHYWMQDQQPTGYGHEPSQGQMTAEY